MKAIRLLASLALIAFASSGIAQTCSTPGGLTSSANINGNSCASPTGTGDTTLGNVCDNQLNTGPVAIYSWSYGGSGTPSGNITVTPTGWDVALFVGDGASCSTAAGGFCDASVDTAGNGAESISLSGLTKTTTYYLFITSLTTAGSTCGAYNLTTGTLPVRLQSFDIE